MRRLPERVKRRIVEHLACFNSHAEVVDLIEQEFEIALTSRHVRAYDPMSFQCVASDRLRAYHATVREGLANEVAAVPIANRTFRLRQLQKIHAKAVAVGDLEMARLALEQAAKEVGGMFVNARISAIATGQRYR
jgi:hypothetical protein